MPPIFYQDWIQVCIAIQKLIKLTIKSDPFLVFKQQKKFALN